MCKIEKLKQYSKIGTVSKLRKPVQTCFLRHPQLRFKRCLRRIPQSNIVISHFLGVCLLNVLILKWLKAAQ